MPKKLRCNYCDFIIIAIPLETQDNIMHLMAEHEKICNYDTNKRTCLTCEYAGGVDSVIEGSAECESTRLDIDEVIKDCSHYRYDACR